VTPSVVIVTFCDERFWMQQNIAAKSKVCFMGFGFRKLYREGNPIPKTLQRQILAIISKPDSVLREFSTTRCFEALNSQRFGPQDKNLL
jgi:hypothetical protein